jgi:hypothetical protein
LLHDAQKFVALRRVLASAVFNIAQSGPLHIHLLKMINKFSITHAKILLLFEALPSVSLNVLVEQNGHIIYRRKRFDPKEPDLEVRLIS